MKYNIIKVYHAYVLANFHYQKIIFIGPIAIEVCKRFISSFYSKHFNWSMQNWSGIFVIVVLFGVFFGMVYLKLATNLVCGKSFLHIVEYGAK